jgi:hypothetical protein
VAQPPTAASSNSPTPPAPIGDGNVTPHRANDTHSTQKHRAPRTAAPRAHDAGAPTALPNGSLLTLDNGSLFLLGPRRALPQEKHDERWFIKNPTVAHSSLTLPGKPDDLFTALLLSAWVLIRGKIIPSPLDK